MSYTEEMASQIKQEETGVLCRSKEEWKQKLSKLIQDAEYRKQIGENAHDAVLRERTTASLEEDVQQIFQ